MIWELVSQIDILMMLEKSFPYVVFFELRDFGHAVYQWRKGFHTQRKGAPQRRQIALLPQPVVGRISRTTSGKKKRTGRT
jgi:hypothetical protein